MYANKVMSCQCPLQLPMLTALCCGHVQDALSVQPEATENAEEAEGPLSSIATVARWLCILWSLTAPLKEQQHASLCLLRFSAIPQNCEAIVKVGVFIMAYVQHPKSHCKACDTRHVMGRSAFITRAMQAQACGQLLGMKSLDDIVCHLWAGCSPTGLQPSMQCSMSNVAHNHKLAMMVGK